MSTQIYPTCMDKKLTGWREGGSCPIRGMYVIGSVWTQMGLCDAARRRAWTRTWKRA